MGQPAGHRLRPRPHMVPRREDHRRRTTATPTRAATTPPPSSSPAITSFDELGTGDLDWLRADADDPHPETQPRRHHRRRRVRRRDRRRRGQRSRPARAPTRRQSGHSTAAVCGRSSTTGSRCPGRNRTRSSPPNGSKASSATPTTTASPATCPRPNVTGIRTGERGEYGAPLKSQTIVNALKLMQRDDGTVYTVALQRRHEAAQVIVERSWGGAPDFRLWVRAARRLPHADS
jgi:hypothetical protein